MPKTLGSRAQQLVYSVFQFLEREGEINGPFIPFSAVRERAKSATGVSFASLDKIVSKGRKGEPFSSPKKTRESKKPVVDVDSFTQAAIRNVIYDMYRDKEHITLKTVNRKLSDRDIFNGCTTSLWKIIRNIGFKYVKDDPRRGLMELPYVALKRITFLKKYIQLKNENLRQFVFLDETWIFQDGTIGRSWQDADVRTVKKTKVGGARYIVLHAGSKTGFIPGAELVFSSKTTDLDYHGEMNQTNFLQWFEFQLIPNLEEPSTIVMDNASYHSTIINKAPTTAWKKTDVQEWLTKNNIHFEASMFKTQLLHLVSLNKPRTEYEADRLAEQHGHQVLRLPPYHCIFNPIEHIWGITKNYYRDHVLVSGSSMQNSIAVWKNALATVTPEIWANTVQHTEKIIEDWWNREVGFDQDDVQPLIINFEDVDDDDDDSDLSFSD